MELFEFSMFPDWPHTFGQIAAPSLAWVKNIGCVWADCLKCNDPRHLVIVFQNSPGTCFVYITVVFGQTTLPPACRLVKGGVFACKRLCESWLAVGHLLVWVRQEVSGTRLQSNPGSRTALGFEHPVHGTGPHSEFFNQQFVLFTVTTS